MTRKIILCDTNPHVIENWEKYIKEPFIEIVKESIFEQDIDTMIAPGNSFAYMDGGLDLFIDKFFKFNAAPKVRKAIYAKSNREILPVGDTVLIETEDNRVPYLIYAPTMFRPQNIEGTDNVYLTMKGILKCLNENIDILTKIAIPGLGTGAGNLAPGRSAIQMKKALDELGFKQN